MPSISVVIRALNEANKLTRLLQFLRTIEEPAQDEIEIIVVDNESSDATPTVAEKMGAVLVTLPREQFSYPRSINLGVAQTTAPIVVLTVGHALPVKSDWLKVAIEHFQKPKVAGLWSPNKPDVDCTLAELMFYNTSYLAAAIHNPARQKSIRIGIMGATGSAIRRELWLQHPFDERYELGGEDGEWARWAIGQGYEIVRDTGFAVRHSHHLGWSGMWRQYRYWQKLGRPSQ